MGLNFQDIIDGVSVVYDNIHSYLDASHPMLGSIADIVTVGTSIFVVVRWLWPKLWKKIEIGKLVDIDDTETKELVTSRKYIQTMGQKEPPHENESVFISPKRFNLIKYILKEFFNKKGASIRRYMILGGSGMGKSTFSAALYYHFIKKYRFMKASCPIYIRSLYDPDILDKLTKLNSSDACMNAMNELIVLKLEP